jgi:hypothetical protein
VFFNKETDHGKSRQTTQGTEKTQKTAGSKTGALSKRQGPRHCGLSLSRRRSGKSFIPTDQSRPDSAIGGVRVWRFVDAVVHPK